ncbi:MAG: nuclear transport factor 2 family protein [Planktotalea sp.]|uniref:nuclear transport factor 2 family protein n=1 Tax=Planktotalea sp. TaxID=2029877 RepID=UPI003C782607
MSDAITAFFDTWGLSDDVARAKAIASVYSENGTYADPRAQEPMTGPSAIAGYINMFSANAPGWTAKVVKSDEIAGLQRATVAFAGMGPDGKEMVQLGQYFAELDDGKITRLIGFVGTGEPA